MPSRLKTIVSGGQTGVDRSALDAAMEMGFDVGGYVPCGRLAEDGVIPGKYTGLIETRSADKVERTALNVRYSDATLIISHGPLNGGSMLTAEIAMGYQKPLLFIDLSLFALDEAVAKTRDWIAGHDCKTLNIARPPASNDVEIYDDALSMLKIVYAE